MATDSTFYSDDKEYDSLDYKKWKAYKDLKLEDEKDSTVDWVLEDEVITELRTMKCCLQDDLKDTAI